MAAFTLLPFILLAQQASPSPQAKLDSLYQEAYRIALTDSVITPDERALLEFILKNTKVISGITDTSASTEMSVSTEAPQFPRRAKWMLLYRNMLLGNALYGVGIPHVLGATSPSVYFGSQLLAAGVGYYLGFVKRPKEPYTMSQYYFEMSGMELALASIFPVFSLVGEKNWEHFDPQLKFLTTYLMVMAPLGVKWGQREYKSLTTTGNVADGQAMLLNIALLGGAYDGYKLYSIAFANASDDSLTQERISRFFSLSWYLGGASAYFGLRKDVLHSRITIGDAMLFRGAIIEGFVAAYHLKRLLKINLLSDRDKVGRDLVDLIAVNGLAAYTYGFIKDHDLGISEALSVQLGGIAGLSAWYGLGYLLQLDFDAPFVRSVSLASTLGGWWWALHKQTNKAQTSTRTGETQASTRTGVKMHFFPQIFPEGNGWSYGAVLDVSF